MATLHRIFKKTGQVGLLRAKFATLFDAKLFMTGSPCAVWLRLMSIINQYTTYRIEEVGPDRACAEWLVKNGAKVKWKGFQRVETDFNTLPASNFDQYKIEHIDCSGSTVMEPGFQYLYNLKHVKSFILHDVKYNNDNMLFAISANLHDSLEHLQISRCSDITPKSMLSAVSKLQNLRMLVFFDLKNVKNDTEFVNKLQQNLPEKCKICLEDPKKEESLPGGG